MPTTSSAKVKDIAGGANGSAFARYRALQYGDAGIGAMVRAECQALLISRIPGALGLVLRRVCYPGRFGACARGVLFGRDLTLRHTHKIAIGAGTVVDDGVVLDAKGETNRGIAIGAGCYIGRNTIIYCKNGNITIGDRVNIASNCQIFSCNDLTIGADTVIGAYTYLLSGGEYDPSDPTPFAAQSGMRSRGPLRVGADCWLGARVTVLDAADIGDRCVIGAGAVVNRPLPTRSIAVGVPARVIRSLPAPPSASPPESAA